MAENTALKYNVYNPEKKDCPISNLFNSLHKADAFQNEQQIPEKFGKGYCQKYNLSQSKDIYVTDMTFYENISMCEEIRLSPRFGLAFCLEDPLYWSMGNRQKQYEIGCGESYLFNGIKEDMSCTYYAGQHFYGISLQYDPDIVGDLAVSAGKGYARLASECKECPFHARKFSPNIKLILNDIIHCRYCGDIKKIYLEGKALELLAVYLDEVIFENGKPDTFNKFSSADMDALNHARKILDDNLVSPPTIEQLSKLVLLNEYKLKAGFRELFGMPVHTYIIDKRLELAQLLITEQGLSVSEAAQMVGYSNTNHFTDKFKGKFGVKPSEYRKLL